MLKRYIIPCVFLILAGASFLQSTSLDKQTPSLLITSKSSAISEISTPLFSARRVPIFLQAPVADRQLKKDIEKIVAQLPGLSCVNVLENERVVYERLAMEPVIPASTQKLLTAVAALESFGSEYLFTTRVLSRVPPVNGVLDGDVWIVGGGDPLLMTSSYAERYEDPFPYTDIDRLAANLVASGISSIKGAVIGDESFFDDLRFVQSWPTRFRPGEQNQAGPLSSLSVNAGFTRWDQKNSSNGFSTPSDNPARDTASMLDDLLEERDVVINRPPQSGIAPLDAVIELAEIKSPPLNEIISQMLIGSDNTTAELILKGIGALFAPPGSSVAGAILMEDILSKNGYSTQSTVVVDGSGLDYGNKVTCRLLTQILDDQRYSNALRESLPVAGKSGTLKKRLLGSDAEGRVRGKTGSLNGVTSLAGVVETLADRKLSFALVTNYEGERGRIKFLHDEIIMNLLQYPKGPSLELLMPILFGENNE